MCSAARPRNGSWTPAGPAPSGRGRSATAPAPRSRRGGASFVVRKGSAPPSTWTAVSESPETTPPSNLTSGKPFLQTGAKLSVFKFRVADAFLSTDRGQYLYWIDEALQTLNWAVLPVGAYTGSRLAAWISSNYASATYVEQTNEIGVAYDGNRRILNDQEIRSLFPGTGSYPAGATPSRPLSINHHLLGPSFIEGALQIFGFVTMNPYSELFLRCSTLATAADIKGPLGNDIICKCIINAGLGFVMSTRTDEGHFVKLHGPITLRTLRFKLTDVGGNTVNTRGTSVSFAIFLDYDQ